MKPGDLYWAYVPFRNKEGGKRRPVLVLHLSPPRGKPVVVESTSKYKPSLKLLKAINFDSHEYRFVGLKGVSYFYVAGVPQAGLDRFDPVPVGQMAADDFSDILNRLNLAPAQN